MFSTQADAIRNFFILPKIIVKQINNLPGPIMVFGAGGFIGFNLFQSLLLYRNDVYGISRNPKNNWRFNNFPAPIHSVLVADLSDYEMINKLILKIKPQSIFYLAAYGAYAKQQCFHDMYETNIKALVSLLEVLKQQTFSVFVATGSSSEYGLNCKAPKETDELIPNSHYAVSKVAAYYVLKYYGKVEHIPVIHTRLYSVYGPWEEPDRLIPTIIASGIEKRYPNLVNPDISRDFIYVTDVISALILLAAKRKKTWFGETFNLGTGRKTTIRELTATVKKICQIIDEPRFGTMKNRAWDLQDWYADPEKITQQLAWQAKTSLKKGLEKTIAWQKSIGYQNLIQNW